MSKHTHIVPGPRRPLARRSALSLARILERVLLLAWLALILPVSGSDVARRPAEISFASEVIWAPLYTQPAPTTPSTSSVTAAATSVPMPAEAEKQDVTPSGAPDDGTAASDKASPATVRTPEGSAPDGSAQESDARPTAQPDATATPMSTPVPRYTRGGIAFDAPGRLSLAYPVSFAGDEWVRFGELEVLMADSRGDSYRRFITEYNRQLYAYPETVSNTFVLSVHDGTLATSGRELEAEPLRRLIEGSLHNPYDLESIERNLAALIGAKIEIASADVVAGFTIIQAKRMSANDVAEYQYRPMELSLFMEPIPSPQTSFLLLFCSGRQPDEPQRPFPGRYVLVLEESSSSGTPANHGHRQASE